MIRSLGYRTDLALRRAEGAVITSVGDVIVVRSPANPTFWWGNFLLMPAAPRAGDLARWLELFERHHPDAEHRVFGVDTTDGALGDEEELARFAAAGFTVERDSVLTAERTSAPREARVRVRYRLLASDADWAAALELRAAVNAADPEGPGPDAFRTFAAAYLAGLRAIAGAGRGAMFGAFDDAGRLLCSLGIVDAGDGLARYQNVETHPEFRSLGLAGNLVHAAAEWARAQLGTARLVIVADPDYHALPLYERVNFRRTEIQLGMQRPPK